MADKKEIKFNNISSNINLYAIAMTLPNLTTSGMANLLNRYLKLDFAYAIEWEIDEAFYHFVEYYICEEDFCKMFLVENIRNSPLFRLKTDKNNSKQERSKPSFTFYNHILIVEFENNDPIRNENYVKNLMNAIEDNGKICFEISIINIDVFKKKQIFFNYYLGYLVKFGEFLENKLRNSLQLQKKM